MKQKTHNKIFFLLLAVLAATALVLCVFAVTTEQFAVKHNGVIAGSVTFSEEEKTELTLQGIPAGARLQWQIQMKDGQTWVNISGQNGQTLTLSYALVANILDQMGTTAVRCVAYAGDQVHTTDPVNVQMAFVVEDRGAQPLNTLSGSGVMLQTGTDAQADLAIVTVKYVYLTADGKEVWSPYTAQLEKGASSFHSTVSSPATQGYKPASLAEAVEGVTLNDDGSVTFALDSVNEDITVTVIYQPVDVEYRVDYFLQNLNDDQYTLIESKICYGKADTYPEDGIENKEFPGFTQLYYDPETIAADGSTVFNCYYDRNYYLINFDLDGGFGTDPVYARFQDSLVVPKPTRPGYVFGGWDLVSITLPDGNGNEVLVTHPSGDNTEYNDGVTDSLIPSIGTYTDGTIVLGNYTYKAVWVSADTTYKVAYWLQNGTKQTYIGGRTETAKSGTKVSGLDDLGTSAGTSALCGFPEHIHEGGCTACGQLQHVHSVETCNLKCNNAHDTHVLGCYNYSSGYSSDDLTAIEMLEGSYDADGNYVLGEPQEGYVYGIIVTYNTSGYESERVWHKIYYGGELYSCTADDTTGAALQSTPAYDESLVGTEIHKDGYNRYYFVTKYKAYASNCTECHTEECIDCDIHTHVQSCYVCNLSEHSHNGVDCDISACDHTHTAACFPTLTSNTPTTYDKEAFAELGDALQPGYIYTIQVEGRGGTWPKLYLDGAWYNTSMDCIYGDVLASATVVTADGTYTAKKYHVNMDAVKSTTCTHTHALSCCSITAHAHGSSQCFNCGMIEHTHTSTCKLMVSCTNFIKADQNVIVEGDGSTVVNVYYAYKQYTLRFYYAKREWEETATEGTGTDATDSTDSTQTTGKYKFYVVGGSTYPFGTHNSATESTPTLDLLGYIANDQWGEVKALPTVNDAYVDRYTLDSVDDGDTTYYYIEFTATYGDSLENLWPVDIFNPVEIVGTHSQCSYTMAYFSAWNGEYRVKYTQDNSNKFKGGNETIKGLYMYLDENIVFDSKFSSEETYTDVLGQKTCLVSFLGFWDNGANVSWSIPRKFNYHLMLGNRGEDYSTYTTYKTFTVYDNSTLTQISNQTVTSIVGYTHVDTTCEVVHSGEADVMDEVNYYFYYNPTPHMLYFWNHNGYLENGRGVMLEYGTSLGKYGAYVNNTYMASHYPSELEAGVYTFAGWYTSAECLDGTEMTWDSATMPDEDLIVFAKWIPKTWTVNFYASETDIGTSNTYCASAGVTHNELLTNSQRPASNPTREGYTFIGWFYYNDRGEKTAFNISAMPVQQNMDLFAEWFSATSVTYTVYYQLENGTPIAEPTEGYLFAGATKTFSAKTGSQLNTGYQSGYYPNTSSASILMGTDSDSNTATFIYTPMTEVSYTVRHVDAATGTVLKTQTKGPVSSAIVTEFADVLTGADGKTYIPETYSQQLVLSATAADNVITFYYVKADTTGAYVIHYNLKQLDGSYARQTDYVYGTAENGTVITTADYHKSFTGFTWNGDDSTATIATGELLELELYYERNAYPYTIKYMVKDTNALLREITTDSGGNALTGKYGSTAYATAPKTLEESSIQYRLVDTSTSKSVEISADASRNVITFYYEPAKTVLTIHNTNLPDGCTDTFLYKVVGPLELSGTGNCIELIVAVQGNGSVTIGEVSGANVVMGLYAGTYEITPLTDWSYRYGLKQAVVTVNATSTTAVDPTKPWIVLEKADGNDVTFHYDHIGSDWLGGETYCRNEMTLIGTN